MCVQLRFELTCVSQTARVVCLCLWVSFLLGYLYRLLLQGFCYSVDCELQLKAKLTNCVVKHPILPGASQLIYFQKYQFVFVLLARWFCI